MNATQCREKAEYYRQQAAKMIEAENKAGMVFGFSDPVVVRIGEDAHKHELEYQFYAWLASLHPKARQDALKKAYVD
jgi:hypothetical protein